MTLRKIGIFIFCLQILFAFIGLILLSGGDMSIFEKGLVGSLLFDSGNNYILGLFLSAVNLILGVVLWVRTQKSAVMITIVSLLLILIHVGFYTLVIHGMSH